MEGKEVKQQHSLLGVVSFTAAIISAAFLVLLILVLEVMSASDPQGYDLLFADEAEEMLMGFIVLWFAGLALLALGLGIGGLYQKERDKKFAVIGTVISSLVALGIIVAMIRGASM